ncbi:hypothetical protein DPMN_154247 [Dreissena polymorpha]|uniref:Uncharacterized protein n=1 Tax=Dreissena polymorpha TaxID=45954 RepID=A0A9D4FM91_DREPO|nr:hypothetical protein DPMN_154247 [Dreissena polymorpha]
MSAVKQEGQKLTVAHLTLPGTEMLSANFGIQNAQTLLDMFFKGSKTIFEISTDIISQTVLTKFQKDWTKNVSVNNQAIIKTAVLTNFHKDWTINVTQREKNALPPGGNVF